MRFMTARALTLLAALAVAPIASAERLDLKLPGEATLDGVRLSEGKYRFTWEGTGRDVQVSVSRKDQVVATARATVVEAGKKALYDEATFGRGDGGERTLLRVQGSGKDFALVFAAPGTAAARSGDSASRR